MKQAFLFKGLRAMLLAILFISISTSVFAAGGKSNDQITVFINGQKVEFTDAQPYIKNGRTLVPFRAIFQAFGMEVSWNSVQKTVHANSNKTDILLTIDSKSALVNSESKDLDVPPEIRESRTFVPLRFISTSINADIQWDETAKKITINSHNGKYVFGQIGSFSDNKFTIDTAAIDTANKVVNVSGKISSISNPIYVFVYNNQGSFIVSKASILEKSGDFYNFIASTPLGSNNDFNISYVVLGTYNDQNQFVKYVEYTKS